MSVHEFYNHRPVIQNKNKDLNLNEKLEQYRDEEKQGFKLFSFEEMKNLPSEHRHTQQKLMKGSMLPGLKQPEKFVNSIYGETLNQSLKRGPSKYFDKVTDLFSDYENNENSDNE